MIEDRSVYESTKVSEVSEDAGCSSGTKGGEQGEGAADALIKVPGHVETEVDRISAKRVDSVIALRERLRLQDEAWLLEKAAIFKAALCAELKKQAAFHAEQKEQAEFHAQQEKQLRAPSLMT